MYYLGGHFTCLFAARGLALKPLLRQAGDERVREVLADAWSGRVDRYSEVRGAVLGESDEHHDARVEMFRMGG